MGGVVVVAGTACEAGSSYTQLSRAASRGVLIRLVRGLYASPGGSWAQQLAAIGDVLPRGAVVSHRAAARLHGLWGFDDAAFEVAVGRRHRVARPGMVVHHQDVDDDDVVEAGGVSRVTNLVRTLVDLAATCDELELAIAFESAWVLNESLLEELDEWLATCCRGHRGVRALKAWMADARSRARPLESALEVRLWRLLRAWGLPLPQPGVEVRDGEPAPFWLDFLYRDQGLAIETDGYRFHRDFDRFFNDCNKQSRLAALGIRTMRLTWKCLDDPETILSRLERALGLVPRRSSMAWGKKVRWPSPH